MAQTVIGIFRNSADAQNARQHLLNNGFSHEHIDIAIQSESYYGDESLSEKHMGLGERIQRFFRTLFSDEHEVARYSKAASRGTVVTVHALTEEEADAAALILDDHGAVDIDEYAAADHSNPAGSLNTGPVENEVNRMSGASGTEMNTGEERSRSRIVKRQVEEHNRLREQVRIEDANGFKEVDEKQKAVRESLRTTEVNREDLTSSGDRKDRDDEKERHIHGDDFHSQRPGII
ncbi:hypothetical protein GZH53_19330 [Flavihumibacter sp. R14]|nr:hypothetical protein [Flavihumibacter soli]